MNKNRVKRSTTSKGRARVGIPRIFALGVLPVAICLGVAGGVLWNRAKPAVPSQDSKSNETNTLPVAAESPRTVANLGQEKLVGRWARPDGGYVLSIKSVEDNGTLNATYHNPHPINVSRAEYSQPGSLTKVFVELRDANYPGSTYSLVYHPQSDQLRGTYYQAALKQEFEVLFERIK